MNKLSDNKAPGHDHITIEHIKHSHPLIVIILAKLFDILLYTGFVPDDFGVGLTTPLPKFKGSKKIVFADDFRGITISPIISKLFEHCLVDFLSPMKRSERQCF